MEFNNFKLFNHTSAKTLGMQPMMSTLKYYSTGAKFENLNLPLLHLTASQSEKQFTNPNFMPPQKVVVSHVSIVQNYPTMAPPEERPPSPHYCGKVTKCCKTPPKKSPNNMFYRNLIEELGTERKNTKTSRQIDEKVTDSEPEWLETWVEPCPYEIISQTPTSYEIRFNNAKKPKPKLRKPTKSPSPKPSISRMYQLESPMYMYNFLDDIEDESSSSKGSSVTAEDEDSEDSYYPNNMETQHRRQDSTGDSSDDNIVFGETNEINQNTTTDDEDDEGDDEFPESPTGCYSGRVVNKRVRCISDCDSEDSFIISFDDNTSCVDDDDDDESTNGDDESSDSDDESIDEIDCTCPVPECGPNSIKTLSTLVKQNCNIKVKKKKVSNSHIMLFPSIYFRDSSFLKMILQLKMSFSTSYKATYRSYFTLKRFQKYTSFYI